VLDAHGKQVGKIISVSQGFATDNIGQPSPALVMLNAGAYNFAVNVNQTGFAGQDIFVYFQSSNCTGTPFLGTVRNFGWPFWPVVAVAGTRHTVYLADPNGTPTSITAHSWFEDAAGIGTCITASFNVNEAVPALPLIDLATEFTPPFSVR
jgi:hypothetical protein